MIAKKHISKERDGDIEVIKLHVITIDIPIEKLEYFYGDWDDYEEAYQKGIVIDWNDDVAYIEIDCFIEALKEIKAEIEEDEEQDDNIRYYNAVELIKCLEPYAGYTIYPDEKKQRDDNPK